MLTSSIALYYLSRYVLPLVEFSHLYWLFQLLSTFSSLLAPRYSHLSVESLALSLIQFCHTIPLSNLSSHLSYVHILVLKSELLIAQSFRILIKDIGFRCLATRVHLIESEDRLLFLPFKSLKESLISLSYFEHLEF